MYTKNEKIRSSLLQIVKGTFIIEESYKGVVYPFSILQERHMITYDFQ